MPKLIQRSRTLSLGDFEAARVTTVTYSYENREKI